jgi:probable F420-dependent oxidoreductase
MPDGCVTTEQLIVSCSDVLFESPNVGNVMNDVSTSSRTVRLTLGLQSHARLHGDDFRRFVEFAQVAEASGFDGVLLGDHVVIGGHLDCYPYPPVHFAEHDPWLEPLTVLAAVAAVTSRVVLATGVLVSPLRPAVLLAKMAATVDVISSGRLELGVGVGWQADEFAAVGADFTRRGELLTDGIRACRELWRRRPASYSSTTVDFERVWCCPSPVRSDGIPILFSGSLHKRNVNRIVELGVGWITHPGAPMKEIAEGALLLRESFTAAGRDPDELRVRTRLPVSSASHGAFDAHASLADIDAYIAAGVTDLTVWSTSLSRSPAQILRRIEQLGTAWREWQARY